jgi:hypothetical protein
VSTREAEKALASLEEVVRRRARPGAYLARAVLLTLGQALREEGPASCAGLLERARVAGESAGPAWSEAVQTELTLACGEFAQGVDPRYLGLPNYDLGYTSAARRRLGDRLEAARELGYGLSTREAQVLELADRVLAKHLAERGLGATGQGSRLGAVTPEDRSVHKDNHN